MVYLFVGLAGIVGALLRYELGLRVHWEPNALFPAGTLLINLTGCFLLSFLANWLPTRRLSVELRTALTTGFVGSYTTFSTFAVENVRLLQAGHIALAAAYIALSLFGGLAMTWAGDRLGAKLAGKAGNAHA